ncbi:MAG: ATP phosphoribosyltransferase [Bacteroidota bacterium]
MSPSSQPLLRVALPNKGALSDEAIRLVTEAGYRVRRARSGLVARDNRNHVEFFFIRPRDIAIYVSNGVLDLGITGLDLLRDSEVPAVSALRLAFGQASFYYAVPQDQDRTPDDLGGLRIATSYEHLVQQDLDQRGLDATVIHLDGAVEISIKLGVADAVADVVQTGRTLYEAGLKTIGAPILESEALLIAPDEAMLQRPDVDVFVKRLKGIVVARAYVLVEYDVHEDHLDEACLITPGLESPTISPLSKEGWRAVKAMAPKRDVHDIIDRLDEVGAVGIFVTDLRTCRI